MHTIDNSTVVRIRLRSGTGETPSVLGEQVVATGFPWRDDKTAVVIGPTGVALGANGTLYVADALSNRIAAVPDAMTRTTALAGAAMTVSHGGALSQPLGLTMAPKGDITTNAGNGNVVETTPSGKLLLLKPADPKSGAGSLFGLAIAPGGTVSTSSTTARTPSPYFAADDLRRRPPRVHSIGMLRAGPEVRRSSPQRRNHGCVKRRSAGVGHPSSGRKRDVIAGAQRKRELRPKVVDALDRALSETVVSGRPYIGGVVRLGSSLGRCSMFDRRKGAVVCLE
jgi:hypothetical protein